VDPAVGTAKFMFTAILGVDGFYLRDLMPSQCRFNISYFVEPVIVPLVQTVFPKGTRYTRQLNLHLDNCRVHFSKVTEQFFIENQLLYVSHPPYSPVELLAIRACSIVAKIENIAKVSSITFYENTKNWLELSYQILHQND
jgi:hypothetical protein